MILQCPFYYFYLKPKHYLYSSFYHLNLKSINLNLYIVLQNYLGLVNYCYRRCWWHFFECVKRWNLIDLLLKICYPAVIKLKRNLLKIMSGARKCYLRTLFYNSISQILWLNDRVYLYLTARHCDFLYI